MIELMLVIAIIGILAAVALPAYQNYAARTKVTEGLRMAGGLKTSVSEIYTLRGTLTGADSGSMGLPAASSLSGNYVNKVSVKDGVITVEFDPASTGSALGGNRVVLTPVTSAGSVQWDCSSPDVPARVLPSSCR